MKYPPRVLLAVSTPEVVMTTPAQTALPAARETVSRECEYLAAEVAAFERFVTRVEAVQIDPRVPDGGTAIVHSPRNLVRPVEDAPFRAVRRAYQETVLSVTHWQEVYGESTASESFEGEFSPEVATLLVQPGANQFTPALRERLLREIEHVIQVRSRTLTHLDAEAAELGRLAAALDPIIAEIASVEQAEGAFEKRADRIRSAERSLSALLESHQAYIHSRPTEVYQIFRSSVYEGMATTFPGLSTIAAVLSRLERAEYRLWAGL